MESNRLNLLFPSYEDLSALTVNIDHQIIINYLNYGLYIFKPECNVILKSLTEFNFNDNNDNINVLRIIIDNIDKMPNIKIFKLNYWFNEFDQIGKIKIISEFIQKLLDLKLNEIYFQFGSDYKFVYSSKIKKYYVSPNLEKLFKFKFELFSFK